MIGFERCSIAYVSDGYRRQLLREATLLFDPAERVCVLAPPRSGKTTIAHLIAGFIEPQKGTVLRGANLSWPLGFAGVLHPAISGADNIAIIADLAGLPVDELYAYVMEFSELGVALRQPVQTYSSTMRAQLATSLSIAMPAETYVVDTVVGAGSPSFRAKCEVAFEQRLERSGLFLITNSLRQAERFGEDFFLLEDRQFHRVESFAVAKARLERLTQREDDLAFIAHGLSNA
jgi:capsular polysaccharide transport system ATP-binding protein